MSLFTINLRINFNFTEHLEVWKNALRPFYETFSQFKKIEDVLIISLLTLKACFVYRRAVCIKSHLV